MYSLKKNTHTKEATKSSITRRLWTDWTVSWRDNSHKTSVVNLTFPLPVMAMQSKGQGTFLEFLILLFIQSTCVTIAVQSQIQAPYSIIVKS